MLLHLFGEIKSGAEQNRREEKRREEKKRKEMTRDQLWRRREANIRSDLSPTVYSYKDAIKSLRP